MLREQTTLSLRRFGHDFDSLDNVYCRRWVEATVNVKTNLLEVTIVFPDRHLAWKVMLNSDFKSLCVSCEPKERYFCSSVCIYVVARCFVSFCFQKIDDDQWFEFRAGQLFGFCEIDNIRKTYCFEYLISRSIFNLFLLILQAFRNKINKFQLKLKYARKIIDHFFVIKSNPRTQNVFFLCSFHTQEYELWVLKTHEYGV